MHLVKGSWKTFSTRCAANTMALICFHFELEPRHQHMKPPAHAENCIQVWGFQSDSRAKKVLFWFPPTFNPTVAVKANQRTSERRVGTRVESCHILNSPPADGALLVRLGRGAPDGGRCKCPSSRSLHSTSAPAPFFCLITNLSRGLPPSSHLRFRWRPCRHRRPHLRPRGRELEARKWLLLF